MHTAAGLGARKRHQSTLYNRVRHIRYFANAYADSDSDSNAHSNSEQQWP